MNFKWLRGACTIIEGAGVRVLCDPWLDDGIYYGSWAHYPAYDWKDDLGVDYIYASHIHPDHLDPQTMKRLPKVPVLIHDFKTKFLKKNIEAMGFEVRELPHNQETDLGGLKINIIAADDCNPEICGKFFGCTTELVGDTQIDSMAIFTDGVETYANVNDCPYGLSRHMLPKVRTQYPDIDVLFVAYAGAGPYPQCFSMPVIKRNREARFKKQAFLQHALMFAKDLRAKQVFPFAGDYMLCGHLSELNPHRGIPLLGEVYYYLEQNGASVIRAEIDDYGRDAYARDVLSRREMDYEREKVQAEKDLVLALREAWKRLENKRIDLGFKSNTAVYIQSGETMMRIPLNGNGVISQQNRVMDHRYIKMSLDPRLLMWIMRGPKLGHWNNAEIGSHIQFQRNPDQFERGIHHIMSFLHV